jgi:hypothetical protein
MNIDTLIRAKTPLKNPDGTENREAVKAVNDLGTRLAKRFAIPAKKAGRRRTYRRRRRDTLRRR